MALEAHNTTDSDSQAASCDDVLHLNALNYLATAATIEAATCPSDKKRRIMAAYFGGHLSANDAENWIVLCGLEAA